MFVSRKLLLSLLLGGIILSVALFSKSGELSLLQGRLALPASTNDVKVALIQNIPSDIYLMDRYGTTDIVAATYEVRNTSNMDYGLTDMHFQMNRQASSVMESASLTLVRGTNTVNESMDRATATDITFEGLNYRLPAGESVRVDLNLHIKDAQTATETGQEVQIALKQVVVQSQGAAGKKIANAVNALTLDPIYIFTSSPIVTQTDSNSGHMPPTMNTEIFSFEIEPDPRGDELSLNSVRVQVLSESECLNTDRIVHANLYKSPFELIASTDFTPLSPREGVIEFNSIPYINEPSYPILYAGEFRLEVDTIDLVDTSIQNCSASFEISLGNLRDGRPGDINWSDNFTRPSHSAWFSRNSISGIFSRFTFAY